MSTEIAATSTQYVLVPVAYRVSGAATSPTSATVTMAFTTGDDPPGVSDWKTADWETDATTTPDTYYARCLVGPSGTVTLTAGAYTVWVKTTGLTETPVLKAGGVRVI